MTVLVFDNSLLSDYLKGAADAKSFLEAHEQDRWAVPAIVLFEPLMGSLYGHIDATPDEIASAVAASMEILETSRETAIEGHDLQTELQEGGAPVDQLDALIAASARERRTIRNGEEAVLGRRRTSRTGRRRV